MRGRAKWLWILLCVPFCGGLGAAEKLKGPDLWIRDEWPTLTDRERTLDAVPFSPGAAAVELLSYAYYELDEWKRTRVRWFLRRKILTEDGIERWGSASYAFYGDYRIETVKARTIRSDGEIVDAGEGIQQQRSENRRGLKSIHVSFPRVEEGAILELDVQFVVDGVYVQPWVLQGALPVLESRFLLQQPLGLRFRVVLLRMPPEKSKPDVSWNLATKNRMHAWVVRDLQPIPDLPNSPPAEDLSQRLFVVLESYRDDTVYVPLSSDWKTWNEARHDEWEAWLKRGSGEAGQLARQAASGAPDPIAKAESVRLALRDRFRIEWSEFDSPPEESPDQLLARGTGSSTDRAALATSMLRALGVPAELVGYRHRSEGILPGDIPVPGMLTGMMVRFPVASGGSHYFDPGSEIHAGMLPFECSGIYAMPIDGTTSAPIQIPDFTAEQNEQQSAVRARLGADGSLEGTVQLTYGGIAAERWRRELSGVDADEQRRQVERSLRRYLGGLAVQELRVDDLQNGTKPLVLHVTWKAEGAASIAGKRLILNPHLFERLDTEDWAAETRDEIVHLGEPVLSLYRATIELPPATANVQLPETARMPAPSVGAYERQVTNTGAAVVAVRRWKLDRYFFEPKSYASLRRWFLDVAKQDDRSLIVEQP